MDIWGKIKMFNNRKKISLSDLIDVSFLQELQDNFAKTMGVASLTVDDNGPITKPSNFTNFCTKYIRANKLGSKRCNECDIEGGKLALKKGEPLIYTCHTGLTHFVVPIIVKGKHIASILGGQIATKKPDEEHFKNVAKELGITANEDEYIEALRKIKIVPKENIIAATQLLSLVANSISQIAYKNYELMERNEREKLTEKIIEKIRSTLDAEEVKNYFLDIAQEYFNADRCIFADYDPITNKFIPFQREKLKSPDMKSLVGVDLEEVFPEFCAKLKKGKDIIIRDLEKTLSRKSLLGYKAVKTLKESEAKSDYGLLVRCEEEIVGILILHFIKEKKVLSHDEFDFLKVIREHAGTALCQSKLYEITKQQAERESVLRDVSSRIRSSLDLEKIKHEIVTQVGELFNADRVVVAYYDYKINNYIITENSEYRSSEKQKTFVGVDFVGISGFAEYIRNTHFQGKDIIFNDLEKYLDENNFRNTGIETFYRDFGFISSAAINMYYENTFLGDLVITFENKRKITDDEIKFLKTIADQASVAFHQAELYQTTKQQAEREFLLRNITETIRSTLDISKTKQQIVNIVGKTLNADRCFITEYDKETDKFLIVEDEYTCSKDIVSYKGSDSNITVPHFMAAFKQGKSLLINNQQIFMEAEDRNFSLEKETLEKLSVKSAFSCPLYYKNELLGVLSTHYVHEHFVNEDEINLISTIANQVAIAIHQALLFDKEQKTAQRELLLRNINNKMRNSLNIKEIQNEIVNQIGRIFNADGVRMADYDYNLKDYIVTPEAEYKSSDQIKSWVGVSFKNIPGFTQNIRNVHLQGKDIIFEDIEEYLDKNNLRGNDIEKFYRDFGFTASAAINIYYKDKYVGNFVLTFENKRGFSTDEINFLKTLADQAGVAFYQAQLYLETKKLAEREALLRSITETIRSSLNFDETKKIIVDIIGKTAKADRCFIMEYNKTSDKFLIVNEEYLSSDNILSYKGVDLNEHIPSMVAEFKKGKRLIINEGGSTLNGEKIDLQNKMFEDVIKAIETYKVNSVLVFPLFYSDEFLGDLVLHYVEIQHEIGNDEIDFISLISDQVALALHQSKLYKKVQLQAERERISRNIIEILRSTLDKNLIKHLFVRNIGKYLNADRVFFSEFDNKSNKYLPIEEKSEYLSSPEEKSFACLDFFTLEMDNYFQPLLDKREMIIPNWEKSMEKIPLSLGLVALYKEANVKSSYSFPVLYEGEIMGYFCIEFTHKINELIEEDINRIRSICTQAGIALHHADLYLKAQEALQSKSKLIIKVKNGIEEPVDNILKTSKVLSELELERDKQKEYLNNIINSCNQLLDLTRDITDNSNGN